jgi:hypothetical protein
VAGNLVTSAAAHATGTVNGTNLAEAQVGIGGPSIAFATGPQSLAFETGEPDSSSTSAVLSANPGIAAAFGVSPAFFAIGELGAAYGSGAAGSQTNTSEIDLTVDLTELGSRQDLVVGLYNPTVVGSGITNIAFDFFADGIDLIHQVFTSASAAANYFTDHGIDLGSLHRAR